MAEDDTEDEQSKTRKERERWQPPKGRLTGHNIILDYGVISELAMMQCTQVEIAAFCGCSIDVLHNDARFKELYEEGMSYGRISVRRHQFQAMEAGDRTMLVWLGKQYLDQRDSKELTGAGGEPLIPKTPEFYMDVTRRLAFMLAEAAQQSEEPSVH